MLQKGVQGNTNFNQWNLLILLLHLQLLIVSVRSNGDDEFYNQVVPEDHSKAIIDALKSNLNNNPQLNGDFKDLIGNLNNMNGYQNQYYSDGSLINMNPTVSSNYNSNFGSFAQSQSYGLRSEMNTYLDPQNSRNRVDSNDNTYHIIYSNNEERKVPLFLSKSPLVVNSGGGGGGGGGYSRQSYNVNSRQEINKYFSPYSSIHYLTSSEIPNNENSRWTWNRIEKPIFRTNTARPIEFKHKIPSKDEAWWNVSYNVRKEPRRMDYSENLGQNELVQIQNTALGNGIEISDPNLSNDFGSVATNEAIEQIQSQSQSQEQNQSQIQSQDQGQIQSQNQGQKQGQNHHSQHYHKHGHGHKHKHSNNHKDQNNKDEEGHIEDEIVKSTTVGDIVNLTRLELPNPYDRKVAVDQLISTSLNNLKQENWSIPVEEIINATFIYPGTQQPDLVPNQMGPKVKVQDFYCNPQIHKCTNLKEVGVAIGEPIWKIYNTSTIGRAQRRISNFLDDTEDHLTMGLTQTFIDYIEQEPTIELLESIGKAPSNIFQIPENGSINQFYDNATRIGVFQTSEFISPLPQNKTDQKFANALKKAAIDCLLSNFTLPNCQIPENNTINEQIYGNNSIYQLFKDPKDKKLY
ncbi:Uncharacterized protein with WD40 repeat [Cryptosporidium parvum]|uniref:Uncharacterized protein n=1 Tax=Cryptosporidium parvum TaxID=5807 RepID=A0A7S7REW9_CRYPV|nr:Uncharacterized protein with WD40 repeat [Cryptosporidium parvum]WKS79752.1 putative signal peptide-containing protein [Cryptosporidium sp. 43IA8]|eukprot:QOY40254.1 hypothetical protein CPATCC_004361 [Cryptosporidium parvum]